MVPIGTLGTFNWKKWSGREIISSNAFSKEITQISLLFFFPVIAIIVVIVCIFVVMRMNELSDTAL